MKLEKNLDMAKEISNTKKILVSGPNSSGKSSWAEYLINKYESVTYIATGSSDIKDIEWNKKVLIHKSRRPSSWNLVECTSNLSELVTELTNSNIILDSLGGFVTMHLDQKDDIWKRIADKFFDVIEQHPMNIVIVTEEVGWSLVPDNSLAILFESRLGELAQQLEKISTDSWLVVQGRAINLKSIGICVP